MLVVDASVALRASVVPNGFDLLVDRDLVAPPLMWSEARSVLHEMTWRKEIALSDAEQSFDRLDQCPVKRIDRAELGRHAWNLAETMGWAKTYDAEYLALAEILGCRLVTLDARLRRGADRLGFVVGVHEL